MAERSVLVTGADGLVGSWLVRALLARGDRVVLLRRPGARRSALALDGVDAACAIAEGDLLDPGAVARALAAHPCEDVVHLGAQSIVGVANAHPASTYAVNVAGTWHLLDACRAAEVERVVVASSDKVYGPTEDPPYGEEHPLRPRFPYDVSKACSDLVARSAWHAHGLRVAAARLPNVYGGGDLAGSRLVPSVVGAILAGRPPLIRSDGSPRRDYLHAQDAAAAYLAILGTLAGDAPGAGEAFNAGGGAPHAVREVVELLLEVAGSQLEAEYRGTGAPPEEVDQQWVDSAKLRAATGWEPRVGLSDGLERTFAWYRDHPGALDG